MSVDKFGLMGDDPETVNVVHPIYIVTHYVFFHWFKHIFISERNTIGKKGCALYESLLHIKSGERERVQT